MRRLSGQVRLPRLIFVRDVMTREVKTNKPREEYQRRSGDRDEVQDRLSDRRPGREEPFRRRQCSAMAVPRRTSPIPMLNLPAGWDQQIAVEERRGRRITSGCLNSRSEDVTDQSSTPTMMRMTTKGKGPGRRMRPSRTPPAKAMRRTTKSVQG